eukprot:8402001-Lingulodinium_polyedra.AAC.1
MRTAEIVARAECASVRFASLRDSARSIRPHRCLAFSTRYTTMRSHRPSASVAQGKSRNRAFRARARKLARAWSASVRLASRCGGG